MSGGQGLRAGGWGQVTANGYGLSSGGDKNVLEQIMVRTAPLCEGTKSR